MKLLVSSGILICFRASLCLLCTVLIYCQLQLVPEFRGYNFIGYQGKFRTEAKGSINELLRSKTQRSRQPESIYESLLVLVLLLSH
jgi:hypothetical protein